MRFRRRAPPSPRADGRASGRAGSGGSSTPDPPIRATPRARAQSRRRPNRSFRFVITDECHNSSVVASRRAARGTGSTSVSTLRSADGFPSPPRVVRRAPAANDGGATSRRSPISRADESRRPLGDEAAREGGACESTPVARSALRAPPHPALRATFSHEGRRWWGASPSPRPRLRRGGRRRGRRAVPRRRGRDRHRCRRRRGCSDPSAPARACARRDRARSDRRAPPWRRRRRGRSRW